MHVSEEQLMDQSHQYSTAQASPLQRHYDQHLQNRLLHLSLQKSWTNFQYSKSSFLFLPNEVEKKRRL